MKRFNWLLIGMAILCLATIPFTGCGAKCEFKDFSSLSELQDWLLENEVSEKPDTASLPAWYGRALEVQEDALADGYIVSVCYDYYSQTDTYGVWCSTVINGTIFYWNPETDEVLEDTVMGTIE